MKKFILFLSNAHLTPLAQVKEALELMPADGELLEILASLIIDTKPWKRPEAFVPKIAEAFAACMSSKLSESAEAAFFLLCRGCTSKELWDLMLELGHLGALDSMLMLVQGGEKVVSAEFKHSKKRRDPTICRVKNGVEIRRSSGGMLRITMTATPLAELQEAAMTKWVSCG